MLSPRHRRAAHRGALPLGFVLIAFTAGGCASAPRTHTIPPAIRLDDVPVERSWQGAMAVLRDRQWTVAHTDRDAGLIVTARLTAHDPDRWMDCGRAGLFKRDVGHGGTVTLNLRPIEGGTVVDVAVAWSVQRRTLDDVVRPESCRSKGTLERAIHDDLKMATGAAGSEDDR